MNIKQTVWVFDCIKVSRFSCYHKAETTLRQVDGTTTVFSQRIESTATGPFTAERILLRKIIDIADGALDWLNAKHPLLATLSI